jgi:beta-phosphoglucomutase
MQAVIFDFDGVILETSNQLFLGFKEVFLKFNIDYTENDFNQNYGRRTKEHIKIILENNNIFVSDIDLENLVLERDIFYRNLCSNKLELLPGVRTLLDELKNNSIIIGLGTSTHRLNIEFFMKILDLEKYFSFTLCGNEVLRGKPDPEVYNKVCQGLGVNPLNCIGIEDTGNGVLALKNAGCKAIAVTLTNRKKYDFSKADLIVDNLTELNLNKIKNLFNE